MSFEDDLKKFSKDVIGGSEKVIRGTFIDATTKVVRRTPVDTGRARSNWFTDIDDIPDATTTVSSRTGVSSIRRATQTAKRFKLGKMMALVNNLPYIIALEDGSSSQNPSGMVKVVFAGLKTSIKKHIRRLK